MTDTVTVNIVSYWNSAKVLFSAEIDTAIPAIGRIRAAMKIAINSGANLRGSDLHGADLSGSDLRDADLHGADLSGSDLSGSDLSGSDLSGSDLRGSDLSGSDLSSVNLRLANLSGANLSGADLSGAKQDMIAEILRLPNELDALRAAIIGGKIDGSTYSGECACLAGTMAKTSGLIVNSGDEIGVDAAPFHVDACSPRERFFLAIKAGDTPETHPCSAIALGWVDEAIAIRDMIRATAPQVTP